MTSISTRHIRHDWPEWIDWNNQKTVKTMCGVRSRPGLCGIPGITEQKPIVEKSGRKVWGWCMRCVRITFGYYMPDGLTEDVTNKRILDLHTEAREALVYQYWRDVQARARFAHKQGQEKSAAALEKNAAKLEEEYSLSDWIINT